MANTLTGLIPSVYSALDVVSREAVGILQGMTRDAKTERSAVNQQVLSFVPPAAAATDITPGVTPPNDGDQTIGNIAITLTKAKRVPFRWNGEDTRGVNNGGPGQNSIQQAQVEQAVRTLVNLMEADAAALALTFSRYSGTPGTTPFASDISDPANLRKILTDNGAPLSDLQMAINTTAGAKMRTLTQLTKANEAGTTDPLRTGVLLNIDGFNIRESGQILTPAIGTSSNTGTTDTAGYAIGSTSINAAAAGTGTVLAGDVITFTGDTNQYTVATGIASLAAGGAIVIEAPGLMQAIPTSATTITVKAKGARNMAWARTALILATRLPALPDGGDLATDRATITDPISGMSFEIAMYPQYRQMQYEISVVWGMKNVKPEHTVGLFG
jgi:hypothetical protein